MDITIFCISIFAASMQWWSRLSQLHQSSCCILLCLKELRHSYTLYCNLYQFQNPSQCHTNQSPRRQVWYPSNLLARHHLNVQHNVHLYVQLFFQIIFLQNGNFVYAIFPHGTFEAKVFCFFHKVCNHSLSQPSIGNPCTGTTIYRVPYTQGLYVLYWYRQAHDYTC